VIHKMTDKQWHTMCVVRSKFFALSRHHLSHTLAPGSIATLLLPSASSAPSLLIFVPAQKPTRLLSTFRPLLACTAMQGSSTIPLPSPLSWA
jgi:hypothetical protein